MKLIIITLIALGLSCGVPAAAQQKPNATPEATPKPTVYAPPPPFKPSKGNIRFDVVISDEGGGIEPAQKTLTVMVSDGGFSSSRSLARVKDKRDFPLNIDVGATGMPVVLRDDGKVEARIAFEYLPYAQTAANTTVYGSSKLVYEHGKKMLISQTTDPVTERRTMIEVTATVLK